MPKDSNGKEQGWMGQWAMQEAYIPANPRAPKDNILIQSGFSIYVPGDYEVVSGYVTEIAQDSILAIG